MQGLGVFRNLTGWTGFGSCILAAAHASGHMGTNVATMQACVGTLTNPHIHSTQ